MKKLTFLISIIFLTNAAFSAAPYREATSLEKRLAEAKQECYRNYDRMEAHFKFAGILFDAGCVESAFANVETLLHNATTPKAREFFDRYARRKLESFNIAPPEHPEKMSPEQYEKYCQTQLQQKAGTDPAAAAALDFVREPQRWRSKDAADIAFVQQQIARAGNDPKLNRTLQFTTASANYLYLAAKDYENALPLFIRLYFHDPDTHTALQAPAGFTINAIIRRLNPLRRNRLWLAARRDPVKFIVGNMHIHPRVVEDFLQSQKSIMPANRFIKLCLLASDSVDIRLRSFSFGELMKRDVSVLMPLLDQLLKDPDSGRRAVAALLLPHLLSPVELPEALSILARDPDAVVRMSAEAVAKARCEGGNYAAFRRLTDQK